MRKLIRVSLFLTFLAACFAAIISPNENTHIFWIAVVVAIVVLILLGIEYYYDSNDTKESFISVKNSEVANIEDIQYAGSKKFFDGDSIKNLNIKGVKKAGDEND